MSSKPRELIGIWIGRGGRNLLVPVGVLLAIAIFLLATNGEQERIQLPGVEREPAEVEPVEEEEGLNRVVLTKRAAERLGIQTALVRVVQAGRTPIALGGVVTSGSGDARKIVPYAAVLYDVYGDTWTYTSAGPLAFVRHRITVDFIDGDLAVLLYGPPAGTSVVTVGAAELFGIEFGIGK